MSDIIKLDEKRKEKGAQTVLKRRKSKKCLHTGSFLIDPASATVECEQCGDQLNPMWVLEHLASQERMWEAKIERARRIIAEAEKSSMTKCNHCGKMTKIKRL
jgi:uncharacterized Zn finger protein